MKLIVISIMTKSLPILYRGPRSTVWVLTFRNGTGPDHSHHYREIKIKKDLSSEYYIACYYIKKISLDLSFARGSTIITKISNKI